MGAVLIPLLAAFFAWAEAVERKLSARSELAKALRYIITRRTALTRFCRRCPARSRQQHRRKCHPVITLGRRN